MAKKAAKKSAKKSSTKSAKKSAAKTAKKTGAAKSVKTAKKSAKKTASKKRASTSSKKTPAKRSKKSAAPAAPESPAGTAPPAARVPVRPAPRTSPAPSTTKRFPIDFLWGTATSATQIDGGDRASDWYHFCTQPGRILDGSSCDPACDHWNRYEDDYRIMRELGLNAYRFGVDWSRFQPEEGAPFDTAALDHVREMIASLRRKGIRPLLTLHHFTLPQWWLAKGGFEREENLAEFYAYARFIVEGLGDIVDEYITINEPNVYAFLSYLYGEWPPAKSGLSGYAASIRVQRSLVMAHFYLYDLIHETHARRNWKSPKVSIAKHMRISDPKNAARRLDVDRANSADYRMNRLVSDCIHSGRLLPPLGSGEQLHEGRAWDFFGLNYYTRDLVSFKLWKPQTLFIEVETNPRGPKNDLGWEIYPEGLYRILKDLHSRYGLPIRITENGTADAADTFRGRYIVDHLNAVRRAMNEGVNVEGYYHWSFLDNFEWAEGYTARFGLVEVDFVTQARRVRDSARLYSEIARSGKLPESVD